MEGGTCPTGPRQVPGPGRRLEGGLQEAPEAEGRGVLPELCPHLQGHSEVAAFGIPDNAGVHGRLDAPPPLQVAHGVLVQVPS